MADPLRPLILSRQPREIGSAWLSHRSWFGGWPHLGGLPWPRSSGSGRPMHCVSTSLGVAALARRFGRDLSAACTGIGWGVRARPVERAARRRVGAGLS